MLDFVKFQLTVPSPEELKERIPFKANVSVRTGELDPVYRGNLENLELVLVGNRLIVSGSLHKYFNRVTSNGDHNHDDFTYHAFCNAVRHLADQLGDEILNAAVINLEVGVNITLNQSVSSVLDNCVVSHGYDLPSTNKVFGKKGRFIVFKRKEYWMKVYDKGRQYSRPDQILRIEAKLKTRSILQKIGVWSLSDLLRVTTWRALSDALLYRADKLLIVDSIDTSFISDIEERIYILERLNPLFWSRSSSLIGEKKRKQRTKFLALLKKHGLLSLKDQIMANANEKIAVLTSLHTQQVRNGHYIYLHKRNVAYRRQNAA